MSHDGPRVAALGGGHGLAAALRAVRRYAGTTTAVVSIADDGGSSGRLRRERGLPPPGDIRKCLVALAAEESQWASALEHRFRGGTLDGHALGNLMLAGLTETVGDFTTAISEMGRLLGAVGDVVPATVEPVILKADIGGTAVEGQVAVMSSPGRISRVAITPADTPAPAQAVQAIVEAEQIVLAPGSLFTSVLPVVCVDDLRDAVAASSAPVVMVANLRQQIPETEGLTLVDHVQVVLDHGARVDRVLVDPDSELEVDLDAVRECGVEPVVTPVASRSGPGHDAERLAGALGGLT